MVSDASQYGDNSRVKRPGRVRRRVHVLPGSQRQRHRQLLHGTRLLRKMVCTSSLRNYRSRRNTRNSDSRTLLTLRQPAEHHQRRRTTICARTWRFSSKRSISWLSSRRSSTRSPTDYTRQPINYHYHRYTFFIVFNYEFEATPCIINIM